MCLCLQKKKKKEDVGGDFGRGGVMCTSALLLIGEVYGGLLFFCGEALPQGTWQENFNVKEQQSTSAVQ